MDRKYLAAEIVILRDENWKEEKKLNIKKMIESTMKERANLAAKVTFTDIPSKFLYSSNAAKMRATINGASGGKCVELMLDLFGQHGMKVIFFFL